MNKQEIRKAINDAPIGKKVGGDLYLKEAALVEGSALKGLFNEAFAIARKHEDSFQRCLSGEAFVYDLVKISLNGNVSLLCYPKFMYEAHPVLESYIVVNVHRCTAKQRFYRDPQRSFVLHRKETMIPKAWACYEDWKALSDREEEAGLLEKPPGQYSQWLDFLKEKGYSLEGHSLIQR